jgi:hypothetical protein
MDYYHNTSAADTKSTHPNSHDYQELSTIYAHLDSTTTIGAVTQMPNEMAKGDFSSPNAWGQLVSSSARESTYVHDFGNGNQVVTYVIWVEQ